MAAKEKLDKSMIPVTSEWHLTLRIETEMLRVMLFNPSKEESMIYRSFPLEGADDSRLRSLEETIYDNPLLLSEFAKISCIVDTPRVMVVPTDASADAEMLFECAYPGWDGAVIELATSTSNATILMGIEKALEGFLRRTFITPTITHPLAVEAAYIATGLHAEGSQTLVNLRAAHMDIVTMTDSRLLLANRYSYHDLNDALYYTLATRQQLGIDPTDGEVRIAGDHAVRDALMLRLRDYIVSVAPAAIPPKVMNRGPEATILPYDMAILES